MGQSPALIRAADVLAVLIAASLPWSTTAPSIFVGLWLLVVTPTIDWRDYATPAYAACLRPALRLPAARASAGTLSSDGAWADRLHAIKPVAKLVLIPALLYHFSRSERGFQVCLGFLASCALLAMSIPGSCCSIPPGSSPRPRRPAFPSRTTSTRARNSRCAPLRSRCRR